MNALQTISPLTPITKLLPAGKEWYTSKEAARVIGRSAQYVRDCFDNQKIMGHALNARAVAGDEKRRSYQIPREALLLYLMETANYRNGDFAERVETLLESLSMDEKQEISNRLREETKSVWLHKSPRAMA
jgi:hypothetical protein